MVGNGLTKVNGVGDNELVDADGYEYEPYDMAKITITAMRTIKATRPPGWTYIKTKIKFNPKLV